MSTSLLRPKPIRWRSRTIAAVYACLASTLLATAAHETPINPEDPAYLRRQYAWFQAQDPSRQHQLRKLHTEFQQQDEKTQSRLTKVMQIYNAWLDRLDAASREQMLAAPNSQARLELVRDMREREWAKSLPRPEREEYERLEGEARKLKVVEWRTEESDRKEEWALAQRHWAENPPGKAPSIFAEGRPQLDAFVAHLRENLTEGERKELDDAARALDEVGNYFRFGLDIVQLSDRHLLLPYSKVGPRDFDSLPDAIKKYLVLNDMHFRKKGPLAATEEMKTLRRASGRWPEYAQELVAYCEKNNLKLPGPPLGDCRKDQMPPEVIQFIDKVLEPRLKQTDAGRMELEALVKAQDSWPRYPKMLMDLAKKYKLSIPGWSLPGPAGAWERFRGVKPRPK